ncbi:SHOOT GRAVITROPISM 5-like [Olea europaea subsp. europaea]|uniref:SHOOT GRAVITROPISM 5-like n=1 Tax=Olea europaea subsp. europaea TaxID=158383 RepID=A0A8S0RNW2_OLEEU|nr:SHOOT GRAVITROPISM 5-like [Olea europaea subsp. europaea]
MISNYLSSSSSHPSFSAENGNISKRKRRPAGTPDPDAEVVSLSPKTLLESDRYVCEICNQGFQRDQNLQMHRRRHKLPWKLQKRETPIVRPRVFVCPEPTCLHHDPRHALGDLVGIKKHFKRKHSNHKQWVCEKCSKGYAVQSDYKAHLKTCGTRGHSCDCGRVFSRVESFIEHQDSCSMGQLRADSHALQSTACLTRTASGPSPSSDSNLSNVAPWPIFMTNVCESRNSKHAFLELQLLTKPHVNGEEQSMHLQLSIGSSGVSEKNEMDNANISRFSPRKSGTSEKVSRVKERVQERLRLVMAEKAYAEEARIQAKRQCEFAEHEFACAKRIRQQARAELEKAQALKEHAIMKINSTVLQLTCHSCKQKFQKGITEASTPFENAFGLSYLSSALRETADRLTFCEL